MLTPKKNSMFYLQAGFVEGIIENETSFATLEDAYLSILQNTKEYCIIEWNGIPFILNYKTDIPYFIKSISNLLDAVISNTSKTVQFIAPNTIFSCTITQATNNQLKLNAIFDKVNGGHEKTLTESPKIIVDKTMFLAEWKLLLEQIEKAFLDSKSTITSKEDITIFNTLIDINKHIPNRANRYLYKNRV